MAKKKAASAKKKTAGRNPVAKKKVGRKKTAPTKTGKKTVKKKKKAASTATRKTPSKKPARKKDATKISRALKSKKKVKRARSLGRPRLSADAKLDLVFQKDYQAREIFSFLRVETIRELERFGPDEIIERLAGPMIQTVGRIRKVLALSNRCLSYDRDFALDFQMRVKRG